jgi:outer membrane biosynthesis protein TonB
MEEAHKRDSHLLKFVDLRPKTETVAKAVVETAPEIVEVPEVKVMQEIVPEEELSAEETTDTITTLATETDSIMEGLAPEPPPLATLTPTEVVEEMPQFPGGINALMLWLDKNIVYPPLVIQQKVSGTTFLTFLVDEAGNVIEPKIEEALHPMISATIMRAARNMPKWEPGKTNGKVTIVRVTIPMIAPLTPIPQNQADFSPLKTRRRKWCHRAEYLTTPYLRSSLGLTLVRWHLAL